MKYCLFQLYAPLVSWGEIAVGGERKSSLQPSKSSVIGIIAAALGIRRGDEEKQAQLANSLGFGVRLDNPGTLLNDFHTIQVPKAEKNVSYFTRKEELEASDEKIGTILSRREYRNDAFAVICVWQKTETFALETIVNALKKPVYHLYCGRKSCPPALPLNPMVVKSNTLREAFQSFSVELPIPVSDDAKGWVKNSHREYTKYVFKNENIRFYWEPCDHHGFDKYLHKTVRYDSPLSRKRWQFTRRDEYMAMIQAKEVE